MKKITTSLLFIATAFSTPAWATDNPGEHNENVIYEFDNADFEITSVSPAIPGAGTVQYQWFRNGILLEGETNANLFIPAELATHCNQKFQRRARVDNDNCVGMAEGWSNEVEISFCVTWNPSNPMDPDARCRHCVPGTWPERPEDGALIAGVRWMAHNVGAPTQRADEHAAFLQWNSVIHLAPTGSVSMATGSTDASWSVNPCPQGWKLPTRNDFTLLHNEGSTWRTAGSTAGNAVAGRMYGPRHSVCKLPDDMEGCVFLPASGWRESSCWWCCDNSPCQQGTQGIYWTSEQSSTNVGFALMFSSGTSNPASIGDDMISTDKRHFAFSVRCVKD